MVRQAARRLWDDWDRFFFSTTSAQAMAGFRVTFAAFLFYYFLYRRWTLFFFYGPMGIVESGLAYPRHLPLQFSLFAWHWSNTGVAVWPYYALTLGLIACFALGYGTRLAAMGIWVLTASWLNPLAVGLDAADYMVRIQTFIVMLGALAGCFSRGARRVEIWPLKLLQLQLMAIYFYSGVYKIAFPEWRAGSALYFVLGDELFGRFDFAWLAGFPNLVRAFTYGTLLFELALFPLLVWVPRLRVFVLVSGVALHLGIAATMKVDGFIGVTAMFYLAFLTEGDWAAIVARLAKMRGKFCRAILAR
ncbi:MAG: hypothetical protein HY074_10055 [Deltaproteobacteria bacterium]|nr:hypothetical protein [Deltaproteobacteria bacterium]